ncbi:MAG TPA: DUF3108 domain-containing protein [Candidatus Acidoferrales bacterium]|nr:DUF3108 domain-containing protein [Candidatus Acidoferrales bacterium]
MRRSRFSALAVLLALAALVSGAWAQSRSYRRLPAPTAATWNAAPFRAGEKLEYRIGWMSLTTAAGAVLSVVQEQSFYGDAAWHFRATADTQNALRYLMALDDQFDSYAETGTLATRQYELYLDEQGRRATRRLRLNGGGAGAEAVAAPAGTRDPLAALYELRAVDWNRTRELHSPIFDGNRFYQMQARVAAAHDEVAVPAGRFDAARIAVLVTPDDRRASPMEFTVWLANDRARTPVRVDAEVPVGTVKGELLRIDSGR